MCVEKCENDSWQRFHPDATKEKFSWNSGKSDEKCQTTSCKKKVMSRPEVLHNTQSRQKKYSSCFSGERYGNSRSSHTYKGLLGMVIYVTLVHLQLFGGQNWPNVSPICPWMSIYHAFRTGWASKLVLIGHSWGGCSYSNTHTLQYAFCMCGKCS